MRVAYLVPDYAEPSWGVGMLHAHVRLLQRSGVDAVAVHGDAGFSPPWLEEPAPVAAWDDLRLTKDDLLVAPEVLVDDPRVAATGARRVLFVQGSFVLLARLQAAVTAAERGFVGALAVLPHVAEVVAAVTGLAVRVVPPFVAPYFFVDPASLDAPRPRRVAVFAKPEIPDYGVVLSLLRRALAGGLPGLVPAADRSELERWEVVELAGLRHRGVAELLRETSFFVNVNCYEAFNTTVPEAMAAGAVPVCYEAYGGRDFLRDGENAFVFSNNAIFPLVRRAVALMAAGPGAPSLGRLRRAAQATAARFTEAATAAALLDAIGELEKGPRAQ